MPQGFHIWESVSSWYLAAVIFVFILLWSYFPRWRRNVKYRNLPPGPFCLPLVGYLPFLDVDKGYVNLKNLSRKYGGVLGLTVGSKYVVVIDDFQALKNAYNREEFVARPEELFEVSEHQSSVLSLKGPAWKEQRRFLQNSFRQFGPNSQGFESTVMGLISDVIHSLRQQEGCDVNLDDEIHLAQNNITFHFLYGKRFDKDHPLIRLLSEYNRAFLTCLNVRGLSGFFPWLGWIVELAPPVRRARKVLDQMDHIVRQEIAEHKLTLNTDEPRDYIDAFLLQMENLDADYSYNMDLLAGNVKTLLIGASETSRVSVVWFLLLMAKYPGIQRKAQVEIDSVLGREREPRYEHRPQLPFNDAVVMESMRWKNSFHYNLLRGTTEDTTLSGFDIPKDTIIVHNMTSHFRNPAYWTRPDEFDPSRFLSEDGSKVVVPEHFIPFSYGKRICPGEKQAQTTIFLFAVALLQRFTIMPPEGGVNLDLRIHFVNGQAHPYARFKLRE